MRLDKFLSNMGLGSRTDVKRDLSRGMVTVNGRIEKSPKVHIQPETDVIYHGTRRIQYVPMVYLMLNKPQGYVSATEDRHLQTVLDLVPEGYRHYDLFPAGRLDRDTVGLLLLTNDGPLAHRLLSPKYHVGKTYRVTAFGPISDEALQALRDGVVIPGDYRTLPALAERVCDAPPIIDLTIREGKYHQVKEMLIAIDNQVVFLERLRFGPLVLDPALERGQMRPLTEAEVAALYASSEDIATEEEGQ